MNKNVIEIGTIGRIERVETILQATATLDTNMTDTIDTIVNMKVGRLEGICIGFVEAVADAQASVINLRSQKVSLDTASSKATEMPGLTLRDYPPKDHDYKRERDVENKCHHDPNVASDCEHDGE